MISSKLRSILDVCRWVNVKEGFEETRQSELNVLDDLQPKDDKTQRWVELGFVQWISAAGLTLKSEMGSHSPAGKVT